MLFGSRSSNCRFKRSSGVCRALALTADLRCDPEPPASACLPLPRGLPLPLFLEGNLADVLVTPISGTSSLAVDAGTGWGLLPDKEG